jgi:pimeloyl-ACP methyl ester carboxylesterase
MSTIYLVHGFNVKDGGRRTVGSLKPILEGYGHKVVPVKYGWMHRFRVRACTNGVASTFASMVEPDSIVIAHSNGANVVHSAAADHDAKFKHVFLINPALDADMDIPNADKVTVFYAPSDPWLRLARWIPFSRWGRQGQIGFTGKSDHHEQINLDLLAGHEVLHSGIFSQWFDRELLTHVITGELYER